MNLGFPLDKEREMTTYADAGVDVDVEAEASKIMYEASEVIAAAQRMGYRAITKRVSLPQIPTLY